MTNEQLAGIFFSARMDIDKMENPDAKSIEINTVAAAHAELVSRFGGENEEMYSFLESEFRRHGMRGVGPMNIWQAKRR